MPSLISYAFWQRTGSPEKWYAALAKLKKIGSLAGALAESK
jgi:hypothetical protein